VAEVKTINVVAEEIVGAGRRFGWAWATLKNLYKSRGEEREKWFDTMVIKLDSPTLEGFHTVLRKMVRYLYGESNKSGEPLKWNLSEKVLGLLGDKSRVYWKQAFMTGVYFGYYGYYEKEGGDNDQNNTK